jgi:CHAT domain-containing protein
VVRTLPFLLAAILFASGAAAQDRDKSECALPDLAAYRTDARAEEQRQQHWRRVADTYITCLFKKNLPAEAFLTVEFFKARLLADRMSLDGAERMLTEDERTTLRRMRRSLASLERQMAGKANLGEPVAREASESEELRRRIAEFRSLAPAEQLPTARNLPDWYRAMAEAEKESLRLSYFFYGNSLYAFAEIAGKVLALRLGDRDAVRESLDAYRLMMRDLVMQAPGPSPEPVTVWTRPKGGFAAGARPDSESVRVRDPEIILRFLSEVLLKPFADHVKGRARILVSPDQVLAHAPFDSLYLNDARLGDRAEVVLLPSFALYARLAARKHAYAQSQRAAFLGVGGARTQRVHQWGPNLAIIRDPVPPQKAVDFAVVAQFLRREPGRLKDAFLAYDTGLRDLPGTLTEARTIADLMRPRGSVLTLTEEDASEEYINRLADDGRLAAFRAVHFAAHCFLVDHEPALSAIVLAQLDRAPGTDGYLTTAELASLELRADLVVISGCDFGPAKVQRGDGLLGTTWSIFQSGALGGMLTLWPVRDKEAARLMLRFYEEWGDAVPAATALARAKRWALRQGMSRVTVDAFTFFGA